MVEVPSGCCTQGIVGRLQAQGMLVRDCQSFSGVTRPALRLAVRLARENKRLVNEFTIILQQP